MQPLITIASGPRPEGAADRANEPEAAVLRGRVADAVRAAGGRLVTAEEAHGLVWLSSHGVTALSDFLDAHPGIEWVQLPWAGVENVAAAGLLDRPVVFTCAKGAFSEQVAEHALALTLASLRNLVVQARTPRWHSQDPRTLWGARVTILGGGGIARALLRLLRPFDCRTTVLRRRPEEVDGAGATLPISRLADVLPHTDVLVLALALTPETRHVLSTPEFAALPPHAVVVNVARGAHIDTEALLQALRSDAIGAAALDVTDPEPLPETHPLWGDSRVLVTSHCADSADYSMEVLCRRIESNVRRLSEGGELEGVVEPALGY